MSSENHPNVSDLVVFSVLLWNEFRIFYPAYRSKDVLLNAIKNKYPFRKEKDRCHLNFVHNLLTVATYEPTFRREILLVIVTKYVTSLNIVHCTLHVSLCVLSRFAGS